MAVDVGVGVRVHAQLPYPPEMPAPPELPAYRFTDKPHYVNLSTPFRSDESRSERLDATFIYAGIDLLQADLFAGHMGRQLKGRMAVHQMRKYEYGTRAQRDAWAELVLGVEALLPLGRHATGALETEATYLYDRTGGSIGSLRALLNDAAIAAIISGEELVNRKLLDMTSTDFAAEEAAARTVAEERAAPMPLKRAE